MRSKGEQAGREESGVGGAWKGVGGGGVEEQSETGPVYAKSNMLPCVECEREGAGVGGGG